MNKRKSHSSLVVANETDRMNFTHMGRTSK